jgi:hypothetical protein
MSQPRIKTKRNNGPGPLDWIRTDDQSMVDCFYVLLLTRGLYNVIDGLVKACRIEAEASRDQKALFHPAWLKNAEFCEHAVELMRFAADTLHGTWDKGAEEDRPNTARQKEPVIGAIYPLPGGGIYIPKKR